MVIRTSVCQAEITESHKLNNRVHKWLAKPQSICTVNIFRMVFSKEISMPGLMINIDAPPKKTKPKYIDI